MRHLAPLALACFSSLAVAQSPLVCGATPNNGGNVGGGLYFDLTVNTTVTITELTYNTGTATAAGATSSVDIYLGPSTYVGNVTDPSLWTLVGSTTPAPVAGLAYNQVANAVVIPVPQIAAVTLAPGTYGIALLSVGASHGYTTGAGCTSTTIPGSCTNSLFSNTELTVAGGAAQNAFLSGGIFQPRVFTGAIHYTLGGTPITFAARENYGDGCYANFQSWLELIPNSIGVLYGNTSVLGSYDAATNGYTWTAGTTPVQPVTSPTLGHGDNDDILIDGTTQPTFVQPVLYAATGGTGVSLAVYMNANGYLTLDAPTTHGAGPAATQAGIDAFLQGGATMAAHWKNLNPSLGGTTHFDYDVATGANLFTWDAVEDFAGTSTFQIACFANGDIEYRYGAIAQTGGGNGPVIVGYTPGAGALDPGSRDLVGTLPFQTQGSDSYPLTLTAGSNPIIGTTVDLTTTNESSQPGIGLCFVTEGQIAPPINLNVIGAPDCFAHVNIALGAGFVIDNIPVNGMTLQFPIPNSVGIVGLSFYCQSAWLDALANPFGVTTSNGVRLAIGSF